MEIMNLNGVIDLHIHSAPDVRVRSHDDIKLIEETEQVGARSIVLKSHFFPTTDRAWHLQKRQPNVLVFGSLTLNPSIGGINPYAVETALKLHAKTIWLPTLFASNHLSVNRQSGGIETVIDGQVVPPLKDIFKLISEHNAILATGHLSAQEIFIVVEEAKKQGVQKIVITHPEFHVVNVTIEDQIKLVSDYGVFLERTYAQPIGNGKYKSNLATNLKAIELVGYESTITSTDSGQIENPPWSKSLQHYLQYLYENGISKEKIDQMSKYNPAKMLGLNR